MPISPKHEKLAKELRDAVYDYECKNFLFQKGVYTVEQVMEAKNKKEKIDRELRKTMKTFHRSIEQDLKKKYGQN